MHTNSVVNAPIHRVKEFVFQLEKTDITPQVIHDATKVWQSSNCSLTIT